MECNVWKIGYTFKRIKYDNLLSNIETNREDIDYKKLLHILINDKDNSFEIKTISDIEKYEKIRGRALDSVINLVGDESLPLELFSRDLPEIELYRLSCIERLYGQDLRTAKEIAEKYGNNIDDISRPELRNYIISLQKILSENDINQLKRLLQISEIDTKILDTIGIEVQAVISKLMDSYSKKRVEISDVQNAKVDIKHKTEVIQGKKPEEEQKS